MSEASEHKAICTYLKAQYPNVIFNTDASGLKLSIGQSVQMKAMRSSRGFPDLMIFEQRKGFNALFIELKKTGENIYKKNGDFKSEHLEEQSEMLSKLFDRGYLATFAIGFDDAKNIIDNYLKL